ncbi:hypothetical protein IAU60_000479 [Kwoniella sp. DSM 27419]
MHPPAIPSGRSPVIKVDRASLGDHINQSSTLSGQTPLMSSDDRDDTAKSRSHSTSDRPHSAVTAEIDADGLSWVFTPPVLVKHGMFTGRWLRFALAVAQEPVLGRRKTEKDRRPLGPAPIVRFRAVECRRRRSGADDWNEEEVDTNSIEPSHLICAAELASSISLAGGSARSSRTGKSQVATQADQMRPAAQFDMGVVMTETQSVKKDGSGQANTSDHGAPLEMMTPSSVREREERGVPRPAVPAGRADILDPDWRLRPGAKPPPDLQSGSQASAQGVRSFPVDEGNSYQGSGTRTGTGEATSNSLRGASRSSVRNLYGSLHVAGVRVPAPAGGVGTWFLFTDLSVRQEGTYSLRFRCFDLTAIGQDTDLAAPSLVECQSQRFKVYSPRQVPPLPKPTELAEHFAKQGFKLNTRKNERTVSSPPPQVSSRPGSASSSDPEDQPSGQQQRPRATPMQGDQSSSTGASTELSVDLSVKGQSVSKDEAGFGTSTSASFATGDSGSYESAGRRG